MSLKQHHLVELKLNLGYYGLISTNTSVDPSGGLGFWPTGRSNRDLEPPGGVFSHISINI